MGLILVLTADPSHIINKVVDNAGHGEYAAASLGLFLALGVMVKFYLVGVKGEFGRLDRWILLASHSKAAEMNKLPDGIKGSIFNRFFLLDWFTALPFG